jgi:hypothetical protein
MLKKTKKMISINRFTPFLLEWNSHNGFIFEIFYFDGKFIWFEGEGGFLGINWSPAFLYLDMFFKTRKLYDKNDYKDSNYEK